MAHIEIDAPGTTQLLLGNEAIARGALEAGIGFATAYPGTPSSEIMGTLAPIAKKMGIYAEWSINEMVAFEAASAASLSNIRALSSMKANGVNVIADFLVNLQMTGIRKGLVLVVCDDPGGMTSSNEQDTRPIAKWLNIPMLEPSTAQECKDMTKRAFELSEELGMVCMVRSVTYLSHTRGNVRFGRLPENKKVAHFDDFYNIDDPRQSRYTCGMQFHPYKQSEELLKRFAKAPEKCENSPFNSYRGQEIPELLIISSGICWTYAIEAVSILGLQDRVGILKLGTTWPLPEGLVARYLNKSDKVLCIEEIEPFVERSVMELAASLPPDQPRPTFYGKRSGHVRAWGEQNLNLAIQSIASVMNIPYTSRQSQDLEYRRAAQAVAQTLPARPLTFCPGCPHRASFWAIKIALQLDGRNGFVTGDIGCTAMGMISPGSFQVRTYYAMGGGVGVAGGFGHLGQFGFQQPVIAVCGDSTFFHASIPGLINGVWNQSNFTLAILDNSATAMTGFQPHPGTGITATGDPGKKVSIEALCRSLGIHVEICDPFDLNTTIATLLTMMRDEGPAQVVILRRECELVRERKEKRNPFRVYVNPERCIGESCGCNRLCTRVFSCPGLVWDRDAGKAVIDEAVCVGCGLCADVCPRGAIVKEAL
ncbi:MAG: 4Fe-4S binding protein [Deltaproteobacteria bacterium]|nr:4Fe-4S binding protein [Deltaproteobacteria bacterium]